MITSAALFFEGDRDQSVPLRWLERACEVFSELELTPILFTASVGPFEFDDCYVLGDNGGDIVLWDEEIQGRGPELLDELRAGAVGSLSLDSPRADAATRSDWRANIGVTSVGHEFYMGVEASRISELVTALRRACEITRDLYSVRYGFACQMALAEEPDGYAIGARKTSLSELFDRVRESSQGKPRPKSPDEL
jgi:hypothetical protein